MNFIEDDLIKINDIYKEEELRGGEVKANKLEEKEIDLLKDAPDYEDYTENVVKSKGCGGCSKTKSGDSNGGGCCSSGGGCCSSGGGCCKK